MVETGKRIGDVKKTMIAVEALEELNAAGRVRKPTQLKLADEVRKAELPFQE
jgi:hypothetical protein